MTKISYFGDQNRLFCSAMSKYAFSKNLESLFLELTKGGVLPSEVLWGRIWFEADELTTLTANCYQCLDTSKNNFLFILYI